MPSVLGCSPSGSRYGNVPNELIHRAGPPFLDKHYRGYQQDTKTFPKCYVGRNGKQNYTYKCVDRSRHNGIKGAKAKCAH